MSIQTSTYSYCQNYIICRMRQSLFYYIITSHFSISKGNVSPAASTGSTTTCSAPSTALACPSGSTTPGTPTTPVPTPSTPEIKQEDEKPLPDFLDTIAKNDEKSKIGLPATQMQNLNVGDYRTLVKTLVCGVKTITWGCASCKVSSCILIANGYM